MLLLSGCSFDSPIAKDLSDVLLDMHQAEKEYRTSQKKIIELEKSEQTLFSEAMELTQTEEVELKTRVEELTQLLEKRLLLLADEEASMKEAATFIPNIKKVIESNQTKIDKDLTKLKDLIANRYELHEAFVKSYIKLSELQAELYTMILEEDIQYKELQEQVTAINMQSEIVDNAIEQFNKATEMMNESKGEVFNLLEIES